MAEIESCYDPCCAETFDPEGESVEGSLVTVPPKGWVVVLYQPAFPTAGDAAFYVKYLCPIHNQGLNINHQERLN